MIDATHSAAASLNYALYQAFRFVSSLIHYLPSGIVTPLLWFLRILFVACLGFAAWIRSFSDSSIGLWLVIGLILCAVVHSYSNKLCNYPFGSCKAEAEEKRRETIHNELEVQRSMVDSLEQLRTTLESRARLEQEADIINERWKNQMKHSQEKINNLQQELYEVTQERSSLQEQLERKMLENEIIKENFAKNLNVLSESVESIKNIEEAKKRLEELLSFEKLQRLEDENAVLRATVEVLSKQRRSLSEKHTAALKDIRVLANLKKDLENQLITKETLDNIEKEKLEDVQKLAQKLRSSLSNAKGRLSMVKDTMDNETRDRLQNIAYEQANNNTSQTSSRM